MIPVTDNLHRLLAPRLVVLIGTTDVNGRQNIIPISNITSTSTEPGIVLIAIYKEWVTANTLKTAKGFTVSVPHRNQLELVWKLGQKYSGYTSGQDKIEEFKGKLNFDFSKHGPVLENALGWLECEVVGYPEDAGGNHCLVLGKYNRAAVNEDDYDSEIMPIGNPKPFMQWERNSFAEASDIFQIDYYKDPGF